MMTYRGCLSESDTFQLTHGGISNDKMSAIIASVEALLPAGTPLPPDLAAMKGNLVSHKFTPDEEDDLHDVGAEDAWKEAVLIDNANDHVHLHYPHSYTCNGTDYNGMAMLWLNGGVKGVKVLMQRGFPNLLSPAVLAVFCVVYFVLAAMTSGSSIPAGLVVPMLLIGGSFGRLIGVIALSLKMDACEGLDADLATNSCQ